MVSEAARTCCNIKAGSVYRLIHTPRSEALCFRYPLLYWSVALKKVLNTKGLSLCSPSAKDTMRRS